MTMSEAQAPHGGDSAVPASDGLGFPVVGVAAGAGGVDALRQLLEHLPPAAGMAFVVAMQVSPEEIEPVRAALAAATPMPVAIATGTATLAPDQLHLLAPGAAPVMWRRNLQVHGQARPQRRSATTDMLFRTLAETHRERAIGMVLSGDGSDGSASLARLKQEGGVVLVQAPEEAERDGMPLAALATGLVDAVLPAADLAARLVALWQNALRIELPRSSDGPAVEEPAPADRHAAEVELAEILNLLEANTGLDFRRYRRAMLLRRIERRLQVTGRRSLPDYRALLDRDAGEIQALLDDLLVSVSNFFRDADAFEALERELEARWNRGAASTTPFRAWVAGTATGEEAYTVGMLVAEAQAAARSRAALQVFASDINPRAIATARAGSYPKSIAVDVAPWRLRKFFVDDGRRFRVAKPLRDTILFAVHDLWRDPPFSRLDLACCRNLLIYFDDEGQEELLRKLHAALLPGGLLLLGPSESADAAPGLFTAIDPWHRLYRANPRPHGTRRRLSARAAAAPGAPPDRKALAALHWRLFESHGPASMLVDEHGLILDRSEGAGRYFDDGVGAGASHATLFALFDDSVHAELRRALTLAATARRRVDLPQALRRGAPDRPRVAVEIIPAPETEPAVTAMLVVLRDTGAALPAPPDEAPRDPMYGSLAQQLELTRAELAGSQGESESALRELTASHEALQAMNEDLSAAAEELETSREELQSVNEELGTLNVELHGELAADGIVKDDYANLVAAAEVSAVFVDAELRIRRATPKASELFHLTPADENRPLSDLAVNLDAGLLRAAVQEALAEWRSVERPVQGPDGRRYIVRAAPYRTRENDIDGATLVFIDAGAAAEPEGEHRPAAFDERQMLRAAMLTGDYAIYTMDRQGRVTGWNAGAQAIFGWARDDMIGQPTDRLFPPSERAAGAAEDELRRADKSGRASDERWHLRRDGSRFYASGITMPLRDPGAEGFAKICRDLTETKLAEARRDALLESEQQLRGQLQQASVLKDEFLAVMSHELKHPLNLIHVNAELLTRVPEVRNVPAVARAAQVIRRTVVSQAKIIDDLLDLSRVNTGKLSLNFAAIEWFDILERVVEAVRGDAQAKQQRLESHLDREASPIFGDALRVEQIVWNLISNALKFTPPGGTITVLLKPEGRLARLEVTDTGRGIDAGFLPHVFEMFRLADSRANRQEGGLGIGLALVKHLTEMQGGRVAASSAGLGQGASFSVWLPLAGTQADTTAPATELPALSGMRILLVDDTVDTLDSFGTLLELEGARVTACSSGAAALAVAEEREFDLILSDVGMPEMDGYALIAELRRRPATARLPAVALTGYGRPQDEQQARDAGFDAHLSKPVGLEALIQVLPRLRTRPANP